MTVEEIQSILSSVQCGISSWICHSCWGDTILESGEFSHRHAVSLRMSIGIIAIVTARRGPSPTSTSPPPPTATSLPAGALGVDAPVQGRRSRTEGEVRRLSEMSGGSLPELRDGRYMRWIFGLTKFLYCDDDAQTS